MRKIWIELRGSLPEGVPGPAAVTQSQASTGNGNPAPSESEPDEVSDPSPSVADVSTSVAAPVGSEASSLVTPVEERIDYDEIADLRARAATTGPPEILDRYALRRLLIHYDALLSEHSTQAERLTREDPGVR